MVHIVQKHFPHLTILARANGRSDAYSLLDAGVEKVFQETFDTSLRVGIEALRALGFRRYQAHRSSTKFRKTDEEDLRELASLRHDKRKYINSTRERISDLEQTLMRELQGTEEERDAAWDTTTLQAEIKEYYQDE